MTKVRFTTENAGDLLGEILDVKMGIFYKEKYFPFQYVGRNKYIRLDEYPNSEILKAIAKKAREIFKSENPPYEWLNPLNGKVRTVNPFDYFCSDNPQHGEYLKVCKVCKSFYYCQSHRAQYCSNKCNPKTKISKERKEEFNQKYYAKKRRVKHDPRPCLVCSELFTPQRITKQVCSDKCRQILSRKNRSR